MREQAISSLRELNEVIERLRAPGGCPWDREQTHRTLRPYLLEEAYEVLDAIESGNGEALREELGDLLLQVLMHCAIAQEAEDGFDLGDVAEVTRAKMIHRHPHVFADVGVRDAAEVVVNWERLKRAETRERLSLLDGVPRALPALAYAQGVQKRPARVGFDETPTLELALQRVHEALQAVAAAGEGLAAAGRGQDWEVSEGEIRRAGSGDSNAAPAAAVPPATEEALGELLFAVVALARRLRANPEEALRQRTRVFAERFRRVETRAQHDSVDLHDLDVDEWTRRWKEAETPPAGSHE